MLIRPTVLHARDAIIQHAVGAAPRETGGPSATIPHAAASDVHGPRDGEPAATSWEAMRRTLEQGVTDEAFLGYSQLLQQMGLTLRETRTVAGYRCFWVHDSTRYYFPIVQGDDGTWRKW